MISFKDQVLQAREIYLKHREEGEDAWKETATIILCNLHERVFSLEIIDQNLKKKTSH